MNRILNLGCGGERPQAEGWVNLDDLHSQLLPGTPARVNLDAEKNYINFDLSNPKWPFRDQWFEGVLMSHVLEHFDAPEGLRLLKEAHRVLKKGGVILLSVPDAGYFRRVYPRDTNKNWKELFDVVDPKNPIPTFFEAALWFEQHKAILTEDALWCYLTRAGFTPVHMSENHSPVLLEMASHLNRQRFSAILSGVKP